MNEKRSDTGPNNEWYAVYQHVWVTKFGSETEVEHSILVKEFVKYMTGEVVKDGSER